MPRVFLRYHCTIKAVVRSPQTTVPVLIKNLLQIASVRTVTAKLASFDRQLKKPVNIPAELAEYRPVLSQFAMELIKKEFCKARSQSDIEDYTRPCMCSFNITYRLPWRHFFSYCLQQDISVFDDTLVDSRWAPLPLAITPNSHSVVSVVTVRHNVSTAQLRFKLASARCNVIASILTQLPASSLTFNNKLRTIPYRAHSHGG